MLGPPLEVRTAYFGHDSKTPDAFEPQRAARIVAAGDDGVAVLSVHHAAGLVVPENRGLLVNRVAGAVYLR